MSILKKARWVTVVLVPVGLVLLAGCSGDRPPASPPESHEGHDHATDPAPKKEGAPAKSAELRKITPSADYPLKTCVVSGEDLGGMGDPVAFEYDGTEVQFCCAGCIKEFKKDPAPFLEKVRAAKR